LSRDGFFFAILFNLLFVYFDEVNNKYAVKKPLIYAFCLISVGVVFIRANFELNEHAKQLDSSYGASPVKTVLKCV